MPFFKELRRRSKASFRTNDSSAESNGTVPTTKSSSTLNSSYGASTPPSSVKPDGPPSNSTTTQSDGNTITLAIPRRPAVAPMNSNRSSTLVKYGPFQFSNSLITSLPGTCLLRFKRSNALAWTYVSFCTKAHLDCGQYGGMK